MTQQQFSSRMWHFGIRLIFAGKEYPVHTVDFSTGIITCKTESGGTIEAYYKDFELPESENAVRL